MTSLLDRILPDPNWKEGLLYAKCSDKGKAAMTGFIANYLIRKGNSENLEDMRSSLHFIPGSNIWWGNFQKMVKVNLTYQEFSLWPSFVDEIRWPLSFLEKVRSEYAGRIGGSRLWRA